MKTQSKHAVKNNGASLHIMNLCYKINKLYSLFIQKALLLYSQRVECNLCGWRGMRFDSDLWHPYTICPKCCSEVRHRLLVAAMTRIARVSFNKIVRNRKIIHFAPEQSLKSIFSKYAAKYISADLIRNDVDMALDISHMPEIESDDVDVVIACDVLEHVADDARAIREIYRILRLWGYAIITVPQVDGLVNTIEDKTITDPILREQIYGQSDHLRIYGSNFPQMLESAGFTLTIVNEVDFSENMAKKYVLFPPQLSKNPLATNHRKVFFAQKTA